MTKQTTKSSQLPTDDFSHLLTTLDQLWPKSSTLAGVILFGSRAKFKDHPKNTDWDVGIVYGGRKPKIVPPDDWDLFLWSTKHWKSGFALQVEIARHGVVLSDPTGIIAERFTMIHEKILPYWGQYLQRF